MSSIQENGKISLGSFKLAQSKTTDGRAPASAKRKFEGSSDHDNNNHAKKDFITGISENKIVSITQEEKRGPTIIPLPEQKEIRINSKYLNLIRKKSDAANNISSEPAPSVEVKQQTTNGAHATIGTSLEANTSISGLKYGLNVNIPKNEPTITLSSIVKEEPLENEIKKERGNGLNVEDEAVSELLKDATTFDSQVKLEEKENKTIIISLQNNDIDLPLLIKYRDASLDEIKDEDQRFKADVELRPHESRIEDYERTPVEAFGKALLMGMGWREGAPIGLTNPQVVQPIEFVQRPGFRTGLGANPLANTPSDDSSNKKKKRKLKPGESHEQFEQQVLLPDQDGKIRHIKHLDEKLVPLSVAKAKLASQTSIQVGSLVAIVSGPHDGLNGRVSSLLNNGEYILVHLLSSGEDVKIPLSEVMHMNNKNNQESDDENSDDHSTSTSTPPKKDSSSSSSSSKKSSSSSSSVKGEKRTWVYANTIVRVVSKTLGKGKYYLKKGLVRDVADASHCTLQLLDTKQIVDTSQDMLETVIPKPGEKVKIVRGKHSGKIGRLISKDKDKSGESIANIQLLSGIEENDIVHFDLDSITQFVGDDDY